MMEAIGTYFPWWITAICLAVVTLGFYLAFHSPLGVSGSWTRVIQWKNDKILNEAQGIFAAQPKMFEDALMKATIQEFGEGEVTRFMESRHKNKPSNQQAASTKMLKRTHWTAHLVFLVTLILGGLVGSYIKGDFSLQSSLGSIHTDLFGSGFANFMTLFIGGILVGFGTQLGGGCTSGHGLSGVSRLVPASLIATVSFFGAAIIFSFAIHYLA